MRTLTFALIFALALPVFANSVSEIRQPADDALATDTSDFIGHAAKGESGPCPPMPQQAAETSAEPAAEAHPQSDVFQKPSPRIPAGLDPRADAEIQPETELTETERFKQVYLEIEQSFRARGTSPQLLHSLMQALKQPIREATRGPASESNVVDVRRIDEVMRRYIETQDEED